MTGALVKMHKSINPDVKSAGERIKSARLELGLTQEQAAERTELTGQYWSGIERGQERGSVNTYLQIAKALGVTLDDLFYDDAEARRIRKAFSREGLLAGCTAWEQAIASEVLLALKEILERNRRQ